MWMEIHKIVYTYKENLYKKKNIKYEKIEKIRKYIGNSPESQKLL